MSNLDEYIERLGDEGEIERTYAAEDLGYLNAPEAVLPLLERLQVETSPVVRITIFQALLRIDSDETIAGSIGLLGSDDSQIRNLAVGVLQRKGQRSLPFLKRAMREGDRDTRKFVLDALAGIQSSGAGEIYAAALHDDDLNVVITAVENLGQIRAEEFREPIENLLTENAHPMLVAACLEALAGIGNESSLAALRRVFPKLTELPQFFLTPCLKAIAALGGESEFNELLGLLPARTPQASAAVLGSLITLYERGIYRRSPPPEPSAPLLTALQGLVESNQPAPCRYQAVRVLGFWAQRDDVSASLVSCLTNLERFVRIGAAEALRASELPGFEALLAAHEQRELAEEVEPAQGR
jgi:HEAT repeat protein